MSFLCFFLFRLLALIFRLSGSANLSTPELEALSFLSTQPPGVVLTYPYDKYENLNLLKPHPLYAYETTSYVSAYSKQITYLEDEMNLANSGFDWQSRRQNSLDFLSSSISLKTGLLSQQPN